MRLVVVRVAGLVLGLAVELGDVQRVVTGVDRDRLDLAALDLLEELPEVGLRLLLVLTEEALGEEGQHHHDEDGERRVLEKSAHGLTRARPREPALKRSEVRTSPKKEPTTTFLHRHRVSTPIETLLHGGDVAQVAVPLIEVQAVAHDVLVRDLETDVSDRQVDLAPGRLDQQRADLEA